MRGYLCLLLSQVPGQLRIHIRKHRLHRRLGLALRLAQRRHHLRTPSRLTALRTPADSPLISWHFMHMLDFARLHSARSACRMASSYQPAAVSRHAFYQLQLETGNPSPDGPDLLAQGLPQRLLFGIVPPAGRVQARNFYQAKPCNETLYPNPTGPDLLAQGLPQRLLLGVVPPACCIKQAAEARGRVARAPGRHLAGGAVARRVVAGRVVPAAVGHRLRPCGANPHQQGFETRQEADRRWSNGARCGTTSPAPRQRAPSALQLTCVAGFEIYSLRHGKRRESLLVE